MHATDAYGVNAHLHPLAATKAPTSPTFLNNVSITDTLMFRHLQRG